MIGVFDSGIGGITVLKELLKALPGEDYIYYADTDHVPYGTKSKETVAGFVHQAVDYLVKQSVRAVVVACNTATSVAIDDLRKKYPIPIIGMEPAVKPAVMNHHSKKILVTATSLSLKEKKLASLIGKLHAEALVVKQELDRLVRFAESGTFEGNEVENYLKGTLEKHNLNEFSSIVLGCTHFIYFRPVIEKIAASHVVEVIDGNLGTANHVLHLLGGAAPGNGKVRFVKSGRENLSAEEAAFFEMLLKRP